MKIHNLGVTFKALEQAMNLPEGCAIASVRETDVPGLVYIKVVTISDSVPPEKGFDKLSELGKLFEPSAT